MSALMRVLKGVWLYMLTPPWQEKDPGEEIPHCLFWVMGWVWAFAGILLGAITAPYFLTVWGLTDSSYQDALVIGLASTTGFLVQFVGWCVFFVLLVSISSIFGEDVATSDGVSTAVFGVVMLFPLAGVVYAIYLYATTVGAHSGLVTTGVIGGVLVKLAITLGVPLLKSLIFGLLLAGFIRWLRGNKK